MPKLFARPILAIAFGSFILCAETCLHWEGIVAHSSWIELPIHDWFAGALLVWGGLVARRSWNRGQPYQGAAWAFMASLLMAAFFDHYEEWRAGQSSDDWISAGAFLAILGGLLVLALAGMAGTLRSRAGDL